MGTHTREDAFYLVHNFHGRSDRLNVPDILALGRYVFNWMNLTPPEDRRVINQLTPH